MGKTIAQKIIASHLISGEMVPGREVALKIDQTLTQDATGTMAYLALENIGLQTDSRGQLKVNSMYQTALPHICNYM